jgi:lysozyme
MVVFIINDFFMRMGFTKILKELIYEQLGTSQFKRASELVASQWYWDHIRKEESLECKAYDDGAGNLTIGYGHTQDVKKGDVLGDGENCKSEANELLMGDSTYHANKLRKIFTTWEGEGLNILITQGMFDALLSLSYNGGAGGIRRSDVIALLKTSQTVDKDKLYKAAESIKKYRVSMPGHKPRREKEYERFIDGL